MPEWRYQEVATTQQADGSTRVSATLHYRVGSGPGLAGTSERVLVVQGGRVRSDDPAGAALPWDLGPVREAAGPHSLVLAVAPVDPRTFDPLAERAVRAVTTAWGSDWARRSVLVVAPDPAGLARLLGEPSAALGGRVAVARSDRVLLDGAGLAELAPAGQQEVLTHETTHLATRAATVASVPPWLEEGFADHVALRGSTIRPVALLTPLLDQVARTGPPARLPTAADLGSAGPRLDVAYAGALLAVQVLADRLGEAGLVRVYRAAAAADAPADAAFGSALAAVGWSTAGLTRAWRVEGERLAAARTGGS